VGEPAGNGWLYPEAVLPVHPLDGGYGVTPLKLNRIRRISRGAIATLNSTEAPVPNVHFTDRSSVFFVAAQLRPKSIGDVKRWIGSPRRQTKLGEPLAAIRIVERNPIK
jgi:hypothetical protein